jgi:nicotinamide riboside kinase
MPRGEKDRMASEVEEHWIDFQMALSDKRKYPIGQFKAFWEAGRRYAEMTKRDPLIHREVVKAVNGLTDFLTAERKRIPGLVLRDADRLESMVFAGYDSYFAGNEPPGL